MDWVKILKAAKEVKFHYDSDETRLFARERYFINIRKSVWKVFT